MTRLILGRVPFDVVQPEESSGLARKCTRFLLTRREGLVEKTFHWRPGLDLRAVQLLGGGP